MNPLSRPNILWITTHDINPHLSCYAGAYPGAEYFTTPALDELAAQGVRYDRAFAAAPVCSPSRSAIITGCYPTAIGTMHHRTKAVPPEDVKLLPELFRAAGYYTTVNMMLDSQVAAPPPAFDDASPRAHWRNRPDPETPFFAAIHGHVTHESQIYLDDEAFQAATAHVPEEGRHNPATAPLPPYYPDTEIFRKMWARYADLISEMDHNVGEILRQLEEDGLADSTVVVFWSDHGVGMPRGKRWVNDSGLHEPLIVRWPGQIPAGSVRTELVSLMDLAPTMLEVCGIPVPEHMHGRSMLRADGAFADGQREYVFAARDRMDEQEDNSRSARDQRYRYILNIHPDRSPMQHCEYPDQLATWKEFRRLHFTESEQLARGEAPSVFTPLQRSLVASTKPVHELYDLVADPYEQLNLAEDPAHAVTLERLRSALACWLEETGDLGLIPEAELLESWRPGGVPKETAIPVVSVDAGTVKIECETAGSTIGWTTAAPQELPAPPAHLKAMGVELDGRAWRLYTGPFALEPGAKLYVKAWRMGFDPSEEVVVLSEPV